MNTNIDSIIHKKAVGRRKKAVARITFVSGEGNILINKIPGERYLQYNLKYLTIIKDPLKKLKLDEQFNIIANVKGGGLTSQTEAIQLGIARLLCEHEKQNRLILKPLGLLTRDARIKERKKYGLRKARKAPQYSKR
uniref:Small ribosomal subunit protein uS9c n=1 Tax=Biddulphia biddulphiana TaxID=1158022 RepID=A0A2U9NSK3_9STRA|nr:ribosomal protein S9 [Biddulphia biddulphiana]AWT40113.1 ribosomal protein S9 [Biddulphia biddulphiana]